MSVRFDATSDYLQRTASIPAAQPFTWMGWVYRIGNGNYIWAIGDAGGGYQSMNFNVTALTIETNGGSTGGSALTANTWYHVAYTRSGSTHLGYINGALNITRSSDSNPSAAPDNMVTGVSGASFSGRVAAVKVWSAALSEADINAEILFYNNIRTANIYLATPLQVHTDLTDISGNGFNWTGNGTLTTEADPPDVGYSTAGHPASKRHGGVPFMRLPGRGW